MAVCLCDAKSLKLQKFRGDLARRNCQDNMHYAFRAVPGSAGSLADRRGEVLSVVILENHISGAGHGEPHGGPDQTRPDNQQISHRSLGKVRPQPRGTAEVDVSHVRERALGVDMGEQPEDPRHGT